MKEKNVNISVILLDTKVFKKNSIEIEKFVRDNKAYTIYLNNYERTNNNLRTSSYQ